MFQGKDAHKSNHKQVIMQADEALTRAEQAIRIARDKLSNAQRNYSDRLLLPPPRKTNATRRTY